LTLLRLDNGDALVVVVVRKSPSETTRLSLGLFFPKADVLVIVNWSSLVGWSVCLFGFRVD
jgi:hypothetical protein